MLGFGWPSLGLRLETVGNGQRASVQSYKNNEVLKLNRYSEVVGFDDIIMSLLHRHHQQVRHFNFC